MIVNEGQSRLDLYKEEKRFHPGWVGDHTERIDQLAATSRGPSTSFAENLWLATKEVIFEDGENPRFTHIIHLLDVNTLEIVLLPGVSTVDTDDDSLREHLAAAVVYEVPVFPNTPNDIAKMEEMYEGMIRDGFLLSSGGTRQRFMFTDKAAPVGQTQNPQDYLTTNRLLSSVELMFIRRRVANRVAQLEAAQSSLDRIDRAVSALETCLNTEERNEHALQACLTANPILFGLEYRRVIPQHKLGSDYIMDYALERHSGLIDLVEIEPDTLPLFTSKGDPKSELIHAEQQVLDWLEWMEQNGPYARKKLPSVLRPRGIVVIGRSTSLTAETRRKLQQRNRMLIDTLEIFTYDDLLTRTRHMRDMLMASHQDVASGS